MGVGKKAVQFAVDCCLGNGGDAEGISAGDVAIARGTRLAYNGLK